MRRRCTASVAVRQEGGAWNKPAAEYPTAAETLSASTPSVFCAPRPGCKNPSSEKARRPPRFLGHAVNDPRGRRGRAAARRSRGWRDPGPRAQMARQMRLTLAYLCDVSARSAVGQSDPPASRQGARGPRYIVVVPPVVAPFFDRRPCQTGREPGGESSVRAVVSISPINRPETPSRTAGRDRRLKRLSPHREKKGCHPFEGRGPSFRVSRARSNRPVPELCEACTDHSQVPNG